MALLTLPNELLLTISDNLSTKDLFSLLRVSKHLHTLLLPTLYRLGAQETYKDHRKPALCWAAQHARTELVRKLLENGASPARFSREERPYSLKPTLLHLAVSGGSSNVVKLLLEHGADIRAAKHLYNTPLSAAIRGKLETVVKLFIASGASVDTIESLEIPPLHSAIETGHVGIVKVLLEAGCDVTRDSYGILPIHRAASCGDAEIVKVLVEHGAGVNSPGNYSLMPLHYAAARSNVAVLGVLLDHGAEVDAAMNPAGVTPLQIAAREGTADTVRVLLERGADVHVRCRDLGVLHLATFNTLHGAEVIRVLLAGGADANALGRSRNTPIRKAVLCSRYEVVKALLSGGKTDIYVKDVHGRTALDDAVALMDFRMLWILVTYGAGGLRRCVSYGLKGHNRILHRRARRGFDLPVEKEFDRSCINRVSV